MNIILKSNSPRRKELLKQMGYDFIVEAADIDETFDNNLSVIENVKNIGLKKASFKKELHNGDILIGCDTIVVYGDVVYGKPKDRIDAYNKLKSLSGKTHLVISGVGVVYKSLDVSFVEISRVTFKKLSDDDINNYINTGECFDKAGAYAIQGIGKCLVEKYEGSYNNIVGLPTEKLGKVLKTIYEVEN